VGAFQGEDSAVVFDVDFAVGIEESPATFGDLPFECVACQRFGCRSLPDEAPELLVAIRSLSVLDDSGLTFKLSPSGGRMHEVVFLQQIAAVIEQADFGEIWHRNQFAIHRVILDQAG